MDPETSIPNTRVTELYPQLRRLAASRMAMERADHTLQPTALVHEAWIRLSVERSKSWCETAPNMFAAVAESMRRVLIDRARRQARQKRGRDLTRVPIEAAREVDVTEDDQMLLIHEAVNRLEEEDAVRARVVVLKFFGGLSNREVADAMKLGERTVERHWAYARAWLYREIRKL
jgi:RNA polymerase sigma factor (TIGR02999 family)